MFIEQSFESAEVHAHCEGQQQERKCDGEPLPRHITGRAANTRAPPVMRMMKNSAQVLAAKARELVAWPQISRYNEK